jgi:hypothetical protein
MAHKITISDLNLLNVMKGAGQQLTRYIKDEVSIGVHKEKRNRYNSNKYAVVFRHAVDWYELIIKEIRAYADTQVINGGYQEALKDDKRRSSKIHNLHRDFSKEHRKVIARQLRAHNDCFMKNGSITFRGSGSNAFALYLLYKHHYKVVNDEEASNSMRDIPQRIIEKPQPKWKLTKRYVNEYRNSCNVESCPCDSKPSEECITHMKSIRML